MGRKLEFDKEKALLLAMESFWAKGYDATSMRDLAEKLDIHLGSVYNALGDKEKVFEDCLRLNLDTCVLPKIKRIEETENALEAVSAFLEQVVEECANPEKHPGCFLINSLLDITNISERVTNTVHGYLGQLEKTLSDCLRRGQEKGSIADDRDAVACAHSVIACMFSIRTLGKLKMPVSYMKDARDCLIRSITPQKP